MPLCAAAVHYLTIGGDQSVYTAILYSEDPPMCNITEQDATQAPGLFSAF